MKVRYQYRLRPGRTAETRLIRESGMCRYVWNELVAYSQALHEARESIALAGAAPVTFGPAQADRFLTHLRATTVNTDGVRWLREGSSVAQQQTVRDFSTSRARAIADITSRKAPGKRAGMPKFRKRDAWLPTMNYTRRGFTLRADADSGPLRLILPGKISIPVVWSRELPSDPSSVRVSQDSLGHWYASFVVDTPDEHVPDSDRIIGIDWGVTEVATTVSIDPGSGEVDEGTVYDLPHAGYRAAAQDELTQAQRKMARRRPARGHAASKGYKRAKKVAARAHKKVARQRQDDGRKWARKIVRDHGRLAVEDFKPKFLSRTTMAKKSADGAIAAMKRELIWQAHKAGRDLRLVKPAYTTMDCSGCGARATHKLPLDQRTYTCTACGYCRPRDKNSATVMVARAGFRPAGADRDLGSSTGLQAA
ncbi:transposase [Brachybacterium sp. JHP9]|uniref:Transposase n=1 Tax=Brachybacterium equifaecis TaxID=2910770 RepID=A0ABT0R4R2_9MICO|nr:transposase [Brachybacterium equifaecis]